jgi:hypothetical protein
VVSKAGPGTGGDAFAAAHARVLADPQIQFALPRVVPPHIPYWLRLLGHAIRAAWPVLRVGVWIAMAAAVLLLLWLIVRRFIDIRWPWSRTTAEQAPDQADWRPDAAPVRALLAEADALAAAGHYGEAARLVLQRSIEDITRRRPGLVRPATTSRDLAGAAQLPAPARPAFAAIAGVVEASLFADRGATADAWTQARDAYADFALAGHWR